MWYEYRKAWPLDRTRTNRGLKEDREQKTFADRGLRRLSTPALRECGARGLSWEREVVCGRLVARTVEGRLSIRTAW